MNAGDREGAGYDHSAPDGRQMGPAGMGHGGHHWMMLACCVPMIIIAAVLVAAGAVSAAWILFAVLCVGMMALMMRGMDRGSGHQ